MKKLKTLKDLTIHGSSPTGSSMPSENYVYIETLKQEAIKWIKELSEPDHEVVKDHSLNIDGINFGNYPELQKIKEWIKHFFNLTDEDLENG